MAEYKSIGLVSWLKLGTLEGMKLVGRCGANGADSGVGDGGDHL
jgi:hypothetical protein